MKKRKNPATTEPKKKAPKKKAPNLFDDDAVLGAFHAVCINRARAVSAAPARPRRLFQNQAGIKRNPCPKVCTCTSM